MKSVIQVLRGELKQLQEQMKKTPEYKRALIIEKAIQDLQESDVPTSAPLKKKVTVPFNRNANNSPIAELPQGQRMAFVYDAVVEIIKRYNGSIEIPTLESVLLKEHKIDFRKTPGGIASYICSYHRSPKANVRLRLWPQAENGKKRVAKYLKVISTTGAYSCVR